MVKINRKITTTNQFQIKDSISYVLHLACRLDAEIESDIPSSIDKILVDAAKTLIDEVRSIDDHPMLMAVQFTARKSARFGDLWKKRHLT